MNNGSIIVVGSGTIGSSLAFVCSLYGWQTCLVGRRQESIDSARSTVERSYRELHDAGLLPDSGYNWHERLAYSTDLTGACREPILVLEAINEDITKKQTLFSTIEGLVPRSTILASSTSGLPVDSIAHLCSHKERVATAHFANPPHLMPVVEIVPGANTDTDVIDSLCRFVQSLDKCAIRLNRDLPGHLFNRIQFAMLREAMALARDNVAPVEDIDNVVKKGLALRLAAEGPLQKIDLASFDLVCRVCEYLFPDLDSSREPDYLKKLLAQGCEGAINGKGFYQWTEQDKQGVIDARNEEVIRHLKRMRQNT